MTGTANEHGTVASAEQEYEYRRFLQVRGII
jgi:hypothetical protein